MAKNEKKQKRRLSPVEKATNVVLTLVVLGILALAVYAVTPTLKAGYQSMQEEKAQEQQMQEAMNAPYTVAMAAEEEGISVDDFKTAFGLGDDITAESDVNAIFTEEFINSLSLGKLGKLFSGITKEDGTLKTDEEAFAILDASHQFEDSVTAETTYAEVKDYMAQKDAEMQEAMQQAPADGEAQTEGEVQAEGEAPAENE